MYLGDIANIARVDILTFVHERAWAISQEVLEALQRTMMQYEGDVVSLASIRSSLMNSLGDRQNPSYTVQDGKAIIPVIGPLDKRMSLMQLFFGGSSTEDIRRNFEAAMADSKVGSIVLNIDSPGGSVDGTKELADAIYNARGGKPITAYVDGNAMSAAYWIASAADKIIAPETARVGSIGVYSTQIDASKFYENLGVKKSYIYAGKYKVAGNDAAPLSNEDRAYFQSMVDKYYSLFVEDVARNRGVSTKKVLNGMADGKVFIGSDAFDAGLVDKIGNFNTTMKRGARQGMKAEGAAMDIDAFSDELSIEHGETHGDIFAFTHNSTTAKSEPSWGSVDKTRLPRIAHAETGDSKNKSSWGFPHHFVEGGKALDKNGVYTDGTMYLHRGGLNAAWAAANGARSGKQASDAVKSHLQAHRKALGMKAEWDEKEWLTEAKEIFGDAFEPAFKDWYAVRKTHKQLNKEGRIMDLNEFKSAYPDIEQAVRKEAIESFKASTDFTFLAEENRVLKESNRELDKKAALIEEKLASAAADQEMGRILSSSNIPERLHGKVRKQVDYRGFVKEGERFEAGSEPFKLFSAAFEAEVRDWEKDIAAPVGGGIGNGGAKRDEAASGHDDLIEYGRQVARECMGAIRSDAGKK